MGRLLLVFVWCGFFTILKNYYESCYNTSKNRSRSSSAITTLPTLERKIASIFILTTGINNLERDEHVIQACPMTFVNYILVQLAFLQNWGRVWFTWSRRVLRCHCLLHPGTLLFGIFCIYGIRKVLRQKSCVACILCFGLHIRYYLSVFIVSKAG